MTKIVKPILGLSTPNQQQVIHGVERVVAVFLVAAFGVWIATPNPFSRTAAIAGWLAGVTAVYQLIASSVTTL